MNVLLPSTNHHTTDTTHLQEHDQSEEKHVIGQIAEREREGGRETVGKEPGCPQIQLLKDNRPFIHETTITLNSTEVMNLTTYTPLTRTSASNKHF